MAKPRIADTQPKAVQLEAGRSYAWCACGRSKNQPFCDGSHAGTGFEPRMFEVDRDQEAYLCMCKRTANPPYCDGSHIGLQARHDNPGPDAAGIQSTAEEPHLAQIHALARHGLEATGPHGELAAMGVPGPTLPRWDDIQVLAAQLARRPLADDTPVDSRLIIGPNARRPLELDIPMLVSDMSFGSLSEEAKIALARGAESAGTGICSGEGGMLPEEQRANRRYLYELAPAMFGYDESVLAKVQALHFKAGQAAKTGIGGHLPGSKVTGKVAAVRGLEQGKAALSPAAFAELREPADFRRFADRVRELTGGIPVGMKLSANHIEADLEFALQAGADYVILDGRGGATGAAPRIIRDHISVPTIPALARARRYLDRQGRNDVTLIVTGGLRLPQDFFKALCLGADGVAIANAAIQAVGCVGARMCHTNRCPSGVATQDPELRARIDVEEAAARVTRFLTASAELMKLLARVCGRARFAELSASDLTSWKQDTAELAGIAYAGAPTWDSNT